MQEEIFGPVVGFTKFDNFNEAIDIANDTDYGLTGRSSQTIVNIGFKL